MFDSIGFQEIVVIGVIALIVVGPKDLPVLARKAGRQMKILRGMAADFRANFDDIARQAELDDLRKEVEALKGLRPLHDIQDELSKPVDHGINLGVLPEGSPEGAVMTTKGKVKVPDQPRTPAPAPVETAGETASVPAPVAETASEASPEAAPAAARPVRKPRARKPKVAAEEQA